MICKTIIRYTTRDYCGSQLLLRTKENRDISLDRDLRYTQYFAQFVELNSPNNARSTFAFIRLLTGRIHVRICIELHESAVSIQGSNVTCLAFMLLRHPLACDIIRL